MLSNKQAALTELDYEILRLLAHGNRTSEIAKRLQLDFKTVADTCKKIKAKLDLDTAADLAAWLEQNPQPE